MTIVIKISSKLMQSTSCSNTNCVTLGTSLEDVMVTALSGDDEMKWVGGEARKAALGHFTQWLSERGLTLQDVWEVTLENFSEEDVRVMRHFHSAKMHLEWQNENSMDHAVDNLKRAHAQRLAQG